MAALLPKAAIYAFTLMAFAGLCSTLDSSLCAISSLGSVDVYRRYLNPNSSDAQTIKAARVCMIVMTIIGSSVALCQPKLLWCFLAYGALASSALFSTIFSLYWKKLPASGAFWAVILSLGIGTPLSIYANVVDNPYLIVAAAVLSVLIGLIVCVVSGLTNKDPGFNYDALCENDVEPTSVISVALTPIQI